MRVRGKIDRSSWLLCCGIVLTACSARAPDAEPPVIHARFDLTKKILPTPNDILRDDAAKRIEIPAAPEDLAGKTAAEIALIHALNGRDGWPTRMEAKVELSGVIDPDSVHARSVRVFELDQDGARPIETGLRTEPLNAPVRIVIEPPDSGWARGKRYFVTLLGGANGVAGASGEPVVADAAFWFLRVRSPLTDHVSAVPGETDTERADNAVKLEELRLELAPHFEHLERSGIDRKEVAALWAFTPTESPEVVMDKELGKMPLPSDFLLDPVTGRVDLPIRDEDSEMVRGIKRDLRSYDGFGLSSDLTFELSAAIDPATLTAESVRLYQIAEDGTPSRVLVALATTHGDTEVHLTLAGAPLSPETDHVVVLTKELADTSGRQVQPMLPGILALLDAPIYDGTAATLGNVDAESAARVEPVRVKVARALELLEANGELTRAEVAAAWPFRTLTLEEPMRRARDAAEVTQTPPDPVILEEKSALRAIADFPISALTMLRVGKVYEGEITSPDFLDPLTRKGRTDGGFEHRKLRFTMTIPSSAREGQPLKVVIFGHGLMAERRFVLSVGDALAAEGLAVIGIDFPYHGSRTHCAWKGPQCIVNPVDPGGDMICPNPCRNGSMCAPDGQCVDTSGQPTPLSNWPIVGFPQASGGAFLDVDDMIATRDHFYQAITDLSALHRSLQRGDWAAAIGHPIDPQVGYAGQSLGGIMGALFTAVHPEVQRVVLNVPGCDLIDLFRESRVFSPHFEALMAREQVQAGTPEHTRLLNVARWIMDPIDPQSFAPYLLRKSFDTGLPLRERTALIQMATLDFIITNPYTERLEALSGIRRVNYIAEHAFIVVPVEPAFLRGTRDMAQVLGRGTLP